MEKNFDWDGLVNGESPIYMVAQITKNGDAESITHGTEETDDTTSKLIVLFALLANSVEQKTGYSTEVIFKVVQKFLDEKYKKEVDE